MILADILEYFPGGDLAKLLGWAIGFMALGTLLLTFIKAVEDRFKKTPPVDDIVRQLAEEMKGLAPNEKVELLIEKLSNFVTRPELDLIRDQLSKAATRSELESLRGDLHNQLIEIRAYMHKEMHEIKNNIHAINLQNIDERTGVHNRLNVITEVLFELRGRVIGGSKL